MRLSFIFFFLCFNLCGQTIFKGHLADKISKEPVVYANISFLNSEKGVSTTEDGRFEMYITNQMLTSKVHISCLNYKDTVVVVKDILNKTLFLSPKAMQLNEVVISKKVDRKVVLDRVKKKVMNMHSKGLRMLAKYFPNDKKYNCCSYITLIDIHFPKRQNQQSKFRFRIFSKDSITGLPKEDLLTKNIPITIDKGDTTISLDLTEYDIEMPKNGFFIAFEKLFIPFNQYGKNPKDPSSEIFYSPVIGISKSKEFKKIARNFIYVKGKWISLSFLEKGRMKGYVPAISVTLTN
ncbi:MAG: carboxypeptidase-like regulatory domain-containing protein [Flavobacteriaceae bacterium]